MRQFFFLSLVVALFHHVCATRFLGRVNPATRELTWPGTGVTFTFKGTSATIKIGNIKGTNSADLFIDGGAPIVISNVNGTSISTPTLKQGTHTVVLRKRSEMLFGSFTIGDITLPGGTLGSDVIPTRQIEVIGDSISVGYGIDGIFPCDNSAVVEDNPETYAALAATALGADANIVAWSFKGIIRNYWWGQPDLSPIMTELYTRYGANDSDNSYTYPKSWNPQAVVINLGTNDFTYNNNLPARAPLNMTTYTSAVVDLIQGVEKHYTQAKFFLMTSPMLTDAAPDYQKSNQSAALNKAAAKFDCGLVTVVEWPTEGNDIGCNYHPNAANNAAEAKVLTAALKSVLSW